MPNSWRTGAPRILKIQWFPLSILIFGQKFCFLGPTMFNNPQPNWYYLPSQPLDPNQPFGEFDFKPIINPPPDFYKFKPVKANPFSNEDVIFTAPSSDASIEVLDQNIDTMSGMYSIKYWTLLLKPWQKKKNKCF